MSVIGDFIERCDALATRLGIARATLSTKVFNDGDRIGQIAAGGDIGVRRLERATCDLAALEQKSKQGG